jgi:protein phosphatase 1G
MQGWRKRMEDSHIANLSINEKTHIFGVFDGHGGKEVAQFVQRHFVSELEKNTNFREGKMKKALIETFLRIDELCVHPNYIQELELLRKKSREEDEIRDRDNKQMEVYNQLFANVGSKNNSVAMLTGCTATVCLIHENKAYFANAGDSRIVLCKKGVAYPMTVDHKPDMDSEKNRIEKADGFVQEGRVKGNLNLSRSLGDLEYKQKKNFSPEDQMITAFPDITESSLKDIDFIILGCDGIWDCKSNQEAVDYVAKKLKYDSKIKLSVILENLMDDICAPDIFSGKFFKIYFL